MICTPFVTVCVLLSDSAAILAVDHVMAGCNPFSSHNDAHVSETLLDEGAQACNRAFVIGRPPGHHAGPNG